MSTFSGIINYHDKNDSFDWNVVVSGSGTYKYNTILPYGSAAHFKNHPNAPSSTQWVELVGDGVTQLGNLLPSGASLDLALTSNRTVTIPAGSTAAQIQAIVDAEPRNLNGYDLTFQFQDGTYSITGNITFSGFYGGILSVKGNSSDSTVSSTKAVTLNMAADKYMYFRACSTAINLFYIKFVSTSHPLISSNFNLFTSVSGCSVQYCAYIGGSGGTGTVQFLRSSGEIRDVYFFDSGNTISASIASLVNMQNISFNGSTILQANSDRSLIISSQFITSYAEAGGGSVRDTGGFKS